MTLTLSTSRIWIWICSGSGLRLDEHLDPLKFGADHPDLTFLQTKEIMQSRSANIISELTPSFKRLKTPEII